MNANEAARLAAAINILRPEWPASSLRTFIGDKLSARPLRDAAIALAYIACEPETKTPARVLEAGPWWRVGADDGPPAPRASLCVECHTVHARDCPCASRPSQNRADYLATMRQIAKAAKRPPDQTVERARTYAEQLPEES